MEVTKTEKIIARLMDALFTWCYAWIILLVWNPFVNKVIDAVFPYIPQHMWQWRVFIITFYFYCPIHQAYEMAADRRELMRNNEDRFYMEWVNKRTIKQLYPDRRREKPLNEAE